MRRWLATVLLLASSGCAGSVPVPSLASSEPEACLGSVITGRLEGSAGDELAIRDAHTSRVVRVEWRPDQLVGVEGDTIVLRDEDGRILAREGDEVELGGGFGAGDTTWYPCPYVEVLEGS